MLSQSKIKSLRSGHTVWRLCAWVDECNASVYMRIAPTSLFGDIKRVRHELLALDSAMSSKQLFSTYRQAKRVYDGVLNFDPVQKEFVRDILEKYVRQYGHRRDNAYMRSVFSDLSIYADRFGISLESLFQGSEGYRPCILCDKNIEHSNCTSD